MWSPICNAMLAKRAFSFIKKKKKERKESDQGLCIGREGERDRDFGLYMCACVRIVSKQGEKRG